MITPYVGQLRKLRDCLGSVFSVQLSERDDEEVAALDQLNLEDVVLGQATRQPLSQSVRIATVYLILHTN